MYACMYRNQYVRDRPESFFSFLFLHAVQTVYIPTFSNFQLDALRLLILVFFSTSRNTRSLPGGITATSERADPSVETRYKKRKPSRVYIEGEVIPDPLARLPTYPSPLCLQKEITQAPVFAPKRGPCFPIRGICHEATGRACACAQVGVEILLTNQTGPDAELACLLVTS